MLFTQDGFQNRTDHGRALAEFIHHSLSQLSRIIRQKPRLAVPLG